MPVFGVDMKKFFLRVAMCFFSLLLKLRYRIVYKGLDESVGDDAKGVLFLSNHPALAIDGLTVTLPLLKACSVRTLIVESMFFSPIIAPLLKWIHALPVPDFGTGTNSCKLYRLNRVLQHVRSGLASGENFLIYPAGMTKQTGREVLGGTFAVYDILKNNPSVPVVMVRVVGLWGSRFSRAQNRGNPVDMQAAFSKSALDLLKACIFFMPRRKVEVTFERVQDLPRNSSKVELNRWLEDWFNAPFQKNGRRGEDLQLVSYSPWRKRLPDIAKMENMTESRVRPEVKEKVIGWIAKALHKEPSDIAMNDHLVADLGLDSLALAELITYLEATMESPRIFPQDVSTVTSLCLAAQGEGASKRVVEKVWSKKLWNKPREQKRCSFSQDGTVLSHFFETCDANLFSCGAMDDIRGPLSYRQLKQGVLTVAYHIQKQIKGEKVGILLPDTALSHMLTLACELAGKTPVMLNWTVGAKHLESVLSLTKMECVLTSWSFLDLLENVDLTPIQEKILFLEEFKVSFSPLASLGFMFLSYIPYGWIEKLQLFPTVNSSDTAVLLFTSGTESEPKGVPLTHKNILCDLSGALQAIQLFETDSLMSILPPFHSFGFTVTGIMPFLVGIKTYFYSNPTDGGAICDKMKEWNSTLLCAAPSFLKNILLQSKNELFSTLRLIVTGAEKAPPELFTIASTVAPFSRVIEGYGITECSPILTINVQGNPGEGVGHPISGVELKIVDPENPAQVRPQGADGLILAKGDSIFGGYLQPYLALPFIDGWYSTGDLGHLTATGALIITGRLKRFVKIGGEMISLGAVEEAFANKLRSLDDDVPSYAVIAIEEKVGSPKLILFSTKPFSESEANVELRRSGFSNLIRIDQVRCIPEIPLTALGKVSIGSLAKMCT